MARTRASTTNLHDLKERATHLIERSDPYGDILEASVAGTLLAFPFDGGIRLTQRASGS